MNTTLGMRLRDLREDLDLSQLEVAHKINCSHKMISNYELDKRSPDYTILVKLCDLFAVSADFLLGRVNTPKFLYQSAMTEEELQLLKHFKKLPSDYKKEVLRYAKLNLLDTEISKNK
jgi:transcriptional regulator with XRE-family HTH domain